MDQITKPYCHPCQTDDVEIEEVTAEPIGNAGWGHESEPVTRPHTWFTCNRCGRHQYTVG